MAQSERFSLALRILLQLAERPEAYQTSAELAAKLEVSAVAIRRLFTTLHRAGFLVGRKGPAGGARLKHTPKQALLGELFLAVEPGWLKTGDPELDHTLSRARREALEAMNETTLNALMKRQRKARSAE